MAIGILYSQLNCQSVRARKRVEIALKSIRLAALGQVVHDTIRALTKFGQQTDACLGAVRNSNIPTLVNLPLVYLGGLGGAC